MHDVTITTTNGQKWTLQHIPGGQHDGKTVAIEVTELCARAYAKGIRDGIRIADDTLTETLAELRRYAKNHSLTQTRGRHA